MKMFFRKPRDDRLHQPADKKASRVPAYFYLCTHETRAV